MRSCPTALLQQSSRSAGGAVIAFHEHYQLNGAPLAECGSAAVIQRNPQSTEEVFREAFLCAALEPCWSCWNASSAVDGYPMPTIIYPENGLRVSNFDRFFRSSVRQAIANPDWQRYVIDVTRVISCESPGRLGHAINMALCERATVILVADVETFFPGVGLEVVAERVLAATFGSGAIYFASAVEVGHA